MSDIIRDFMPKTEDEQFISWLVFNRKLPPMLSLALYLGDKELLESARLRWWNEWQREEAEDERDHILLMSM